MQKQLKQFQTLKSSAQRVSIGTLDRGHTLQPVGLQGNRACPPPRSRQVDRTGSTDFLKSPSEFI